MGWLIAVALYFLSISLDLHFITQITSAVVEWLLPGRIVGRRNSDKNRRRKIGVGDRTEKECETGKTRGKNRRGVEGWKRFAKARNVAREERIFFGLRGSFAKSQKLQRAILHRRRGAREFLI